MEEEGATFPLAIINLSNPRKAGGALGKHIEYDMKTTKLRAEIDLEEKTVTRRFSDFFTLHDLLAAKYTGMLLPPMPEKKFVGHLRDEFVKTRMTDLERFVGRLLANPYIQSDNSLKQFLTLEHAAWGAYVKQQPDPAETNEGLRNWEAVKGGIEKVPVKDSVFASLSKELEELENALNGICYSVVSLAKSSSKLNTVAREGATDAVHKHSQKLQEISVDHNMVLPGMSTNLGEAGKILATAGRALETWRALYDGQASEVMTYMAETARDDLQHVRAFRQLLKRFDISKNTYRKACQAQDKKAFEHKKLNDKGKKEQAEKLESLLETLKEQVISSEKTMQLQARAILSSELKRYSNWRYANTRRYIAQFAATSLENAEREIELWQRVLDELELDSDEISEMAKRTALQGDLELLPHDVPVGMYSKSPLGPSLSPAEAASEAKDESAAEEFEEVAAASEAKDEPAADEKEEEQQEEEVGAEVVDGDGGDNGAGEGDGGEAVVEGDGGDAVVDGDGGDDGDGDDQEDEEAEEDESLL